MRSQAGHLAAKNYKNWPWAKHMDFLVKPYPNSQNNTAKDSKTIKCESLDEDHVTTFEELQIPDFDEV